jgi:hypothetical protein
MEVIILCRVVFCIFVCYCFITGGCCLCYVFDLLSLLYNNRPIKVRN